MKKLGLIVNPVAGMGGKVGLKGTDGPQALAEARRRGAEPHAPGRAREAMRELASAAGQLELLTGPGAMGEEEAAACGMSPGVVGIRRQGPTTSRDTVAAASRMLELGVDLLLFAGGDGTARDICRAVGLGLPVLGIPAGVKIHSGAFAISPRAAGRLARSYLANEHGTGLEPAEVMDVDEEAFREGRVAASLYGYLLVPGAPDRLQGSKCGSGEEEADVLRGAARYLAEEMEPDALCIVGPGTSTRYFLEELGFRGTLLGVDVVCPERWLDADANEEQLLRRLRGRRARIVVSVIGGQGYIFGRGNQQISARVLAQVAKDDIAVIASPGKIAAREGRPLLVDTGDAGVDCRLEGFVRIITGYREELIYRLIKCW